MASPFSLKSILLVGAATLVLAGCANTATNAPAPTEDAMMKQTEATPDTMMKEKEMSPSPDAMMEPTATPDAMMKK